MIKGKQTVMELETYGKEAYTEKHVKARKKERKRIRVFWVTVSCMLE